MDTNVINGIVRAIVPAIVGYAAAKGWLTQSGAADVANAIVAAIVALASAGWSIKSNMPSK